MGVNRKGRFEHGWSERLKGRAVEIRRRVLKLFGYVGAYKRGPGGEVKLDTAGGVAWIGSHRKAEMREKERFFQNFIFKKSVDSTTRTWTPTRSGSKRSPRYPFGSTHVPPSNQPRQNQK